METTTKTVAPTQGEAAPKKKVLKKKISATPTDEKNLENTKEVLKKAKDVMYKYSPEDMTADEKKKFRAAARRTRDAFHRDIQKLSGDPSKIADLAKEIAEANKWSKMTYTKEHRIDFTPVQAN